ncbi:hypothetical protein CR513_57367, partial [Mucuna pruriens]
MTRFLNGLNYDIIDVVKMYQYVELQEMVHQAIKVEQQLKRRNSLKKNSNSSSFPWKNNSKKEVVCSHSKVVDQRKRKLKLHIVSQCPNKRTMIMKDNGDVETDEKSNNDLMSYLEDDNEELPHDGH